MPAASRSPSRRPSPRSPTSPRRACTRPAARGTYPIVDGFAIAFDSTDKMLLASYGLPLLEATGLTSAFRRAFIEGAQRKYIA